MLLGIVGLNGSGKDTFANYLVSKYNFSHKDIGQEIRNELKIAGKNYLDRDEMINHGNYMREKFGANYFSKKLINENKQKDLVISSIRNPCEAEELKKNNGKIIFIDSPLEIRFSRSVERSKLKNSHGESDFIKFKELNDRELKNPDPKKQQLLKCIELKDYVINNSKDLNWLHSSIDDLIKKIKSDLNE
ncbi:MAG: nucleoside monophosphate kinase [Candidatus ainarchaeum sp.]|nr:nucleoside monophosphate kinase [Candidatus ainarchaeum sp.]